MCVNVCVCVVHNSFCVVQIFAVPLVISLLNLRVMTKAHFKNFRKAFDIVSETFRKFSVTLKKVSETFKRISYNFENVSETF